MEKEGHDLSAKDIWFGRIDWFDVGLNALGGAFSSAFPAAMPYIKYGLPFVTNGVNMYGDGKNEFLFRDINPGQYLLNSGLEVGSMITTGYIRQGLATKSPYTGQQKDKYFDVPLDKVYQDGIEEAIYTISSYGMKSTYIKPATQTGSGQTYWVPQQPKRPDIPYPLWRNKSEKTNSEGSPNDKHINYSYYLNLRR